MTFFCLSLPVLHAADELVAKIHAEGAKVIVASDLLALTVLRSPAEFGADVGACLPLGLFSLSVFLSLSVCPSVCWC